MFYLHTYDDWWFRVIEYTWDRPAAGIVSFVSSGNTVVTVE